MQPRSWKTTKFYTIIYATSSTKEPGGRWVLEDKLEWGFAGDNFGKAIRPVNWRGRGGSAVFHAPAAYKDESALWNKIGFHHGWTRREYADRALARAIVLDQKGAFDYKDTYGKLYKEVRHVFKVVECESMFSVRTLDGTKIDS